MEEKGTTMIGIRSLSRNKPTMEDVAERAKVCKATVSMVMSNDPRITEETRQRVLEVVKSLNYQVNETARLLARCRKVKMNAASFGLGPEKEPIPL